MTHEVYLENDITTLELHQNFYRIGQVWTPRTAQQNPLAVDEKSEDAYLPVTEPIPLVVVGGDALAVTSNIRSVQRLLSDARSHHLDGDGPKVWLRVKLDTPFAAEFKAEVIGGSLQMDESTLHRWEDSNVPMAQGLLSIVRKGIWRSTTPQAQVLTSYSGTGATVTINNANENNWVEFLPGSTVPTPAKITMQHPGGASDVWTGECDFYIGHNIYNDPQNFDHDFHFSTLDNAVNLGNISYSWPVQGTTFDDLTYAYTLTTTQLQDANGGNFRVMTMLDFNIAGVGDTYIRAGVYAVNGSIYTPLVIGDPVLVTKANYSLYDLGSFPLPPGGANASGSTIAIGMSIQSSVAAGTVTMAMTQIWPATSFQHLVKLDAGDIAFPSIVCDNGIEDVAYAGGESARRPIVIPKLGKVFLHPNRLQRLYFGAMNDTGNILGDDIEIRVEAELRALTL